MGLDALEAIEPTAQKLLAEVLRRVVLIVLNDLRSTLQRYALETPGGSEQRVGEIADR